MNLFGAVVVVWGGGSNWVKLDIDASLSWTSTILIGTNEVHQMNALWVGSDKSTKFCLSKRWVQGIFALETYNNFIPVWTLNIGVCLREFWTPREFSVEIPSVSLHRTMNPWWCISVWWCISEFCTKSQTVDPSSPCLAELTGAALQGPLPAGSLEMPWVESSPSACIRWFDDHGDFAGCYKQNSVNLSIQTITENSHMATCKSSAV